MSTATLLQRFRDLGRPSSELGEHAFQAVELFEYPGHRIAKDAYGAPALLLRVQEDESQPGGAVVLRHLTVQHRISCRVGELTNLQPFTVIRCVAADSVLREYFIGIVFAILEQVGIDPTRTRVTNIVRRISELFRAFDLPARKSAQGLWAELYLAVESANPIAMVEAWHIAPDEPFDFADGAARIEVKSFSGDSRIHSFSHRQLRPGPGVDVLIVSLRAERSTGGTTIPDLVSELEERGIRGDLLFRVQATVAGTLGGNLQEGASFAFDRVRARNSLKYFDASRVPSFPTSSIPSGVFNIRHDSSLDEETALSIETVCSRGKLFESSHPRT